MQNNNTKNKFDFSDLKSLRKEGYGIMCPNKPSVPCSCGRSGVCNNINKNNYE